MCLEMWLWMQMELRKYYYETEDEDQKGGYPLFLMARQPPG